MMTSFKHLSRLIRISWVFARYDALFDLKAAGAPLPIVLFYGLIVKRHRNSRKGVQLANALKTLGPSFIKIGQALSTRADLVGEDIAQDLTHLQDRLPAFDSKLAIDEVEAMLDGKLSDSFSHFDETPIAAASIAQVHFATTSDGRDVAVKILRPNIEQAFERDMDMLLWLARIAERKNTQWRTRFKPVQVVQTLAETVRTELDLRYEAAAAQELKHNTRNDSHFHVPEVDWQRSAKRVLTTERINGFHASDADGMRAAGINTDDITKRAAEAFFNQVFRDGFFHADMHPGNLFVLEDGTLAPVDFGIMGRIDTKSQMHLAEILWGFLQGDYEFVARVHKQAGYIPNHVSTAAFAQACRAIGQPIMDKPLNEISVGKLIGQLILIAGQFEMQVQPHLLLLQKTMVTAEGVGRGLTPDVNMWKLSEPLITSWAKENLSPRAKLKHYAKDAIDVLQDMPRTLKETKQLLDTLQKSGIHLSPTSFETISQQRANQHAAWMKLGWATLLTVIGFGLMHYVNL